MAENKKDLFLVLKKSAFEITGTKEKPFELRENSEWMKSRLLTFHGERNYDTVTLQLGYQKNAPRKTFEYEGFEYIRFATDFKFSNGLEFHAVSGTIKINLGQEVTNG